MQSLIDKIKQKEELRNISNKFIKEELDDYFKKNPQALKFLERPKSEKYKKIIKEVRASLRRASGLFEAGGKETSLKTHSSTKERLSFYPELYQKIFAITGKPKIILDLGCGLNPLSYPLMKLEEVTYYAYDINEKNVKIVNAFFRRNNIKGKAAVGDIAQINFGEADLAFLFKMTDVLERGKGHKKTEELVKKIPAKYVVVSFPTLTMSGRPMNFPRRRWIEWMCERLGYAFSILKFPGEIFYIIKNFRV